MIIQRKSVMLMALDTATIPAEEWEVLDQKIKTFSKHVKSFQQEIKEKLE